MFPFDYHLHSKFSEDGTEGMEAMCLRAVELGIPEIGFSEHWDVGPYEKKPRFFKPKAWYSEMVRLRGLFWGKLIIRAGVEIAEPHLYLQPAADLLSRYPFDYVLGSVHFVGSNFVFDEAYFHSHHAVELYPAYFSEVESMLQIADINVVSHLDIPVRTGKLIFGYDPTQYEEQIRRILSLIIGRDLALEVNTSGLRKPAKNLMPDPVILKWYAEMGGERLTIGSDAHAAAQVGKHLDVALEAIRAAGFSQLTQFENRKAQQILLPSP